jgi:hypothetical protein
MIDVPKDGPYAVDRYIHRPAGGEARGSGEAVAGLGGEAVAGFGGEAVAGHGGRRWPGSGHRQAKTALISARFLGFCQRGPIWLVT